MASSNAKKYLKGSNRNKNTNNTPDGKRQFSRDGEDYTKNTVSKRRGEVRGSAGEVNHKFNDWTWYAKNQQMLEDSASFSYNAPLGTDLPFGKMFPSADLSMVKAHLKAVPGLYSLRFVPTPGLSISSTSPANLAAQNIYSYIRYMNSGAKNYDQADILLYLLSMDSIYTMWNWAKRMYGYARTYSNRNKYLPRVFALSEAIAFEDLVSNLADFRYRLNQLASQISSFCVPAVMPLFIRHSWMVSNIYKDSDSDKAQMYMFSPDVFYEYDETGSKYGGRLVANKLKDANEHNVYTYRDVCSLIQSMLDQVAYSEDIGVMSGDILKAYGQDKLFKLTPVEPDYQVVPVYNEEVLNQIHNSKMSPITSDYSQLNITQDPDSGFIIWNPTLKKDVMQQTAAMVNMPWDNVTPANTMVATRLTSLQNSEDKFICVGSEFVSNRVLFTLGSDGSFHWMGIGNYLVVSSATPDTIDASQVRSTMLVTSMASNFDWHPLMFNVHVTQPSGGVGTFTLVGIVGDINNYTIIDSYNMEQLHTCALLSEFNVPQIGSF